MLRSLCSTQRAKHTHFRNFPCHKIIIPHAKRRYASTASNAPPTILPDTSAIAEPLPSIASGTPLDPLMVPRPSVVGVDGTALVSKAVEGTVHPGFWSQVQDGLTVPFDGLHHLLGLPWWGTLLVTSVGLRVLLVPLQVKQLRNSLKSAQLILALDKVQKEGIAVEPQQLDALRLNILELTKSNFKTIFQMSIFQMCSFFGILRLSQIEPLKSQLSTGGMYWFTDLSISDPTFGLALIASVFMIFSIYWPYVVNKKPPTRIIMFISIFLPCIGIAVSTQFPASWMVYMLGTSIYSFMINVIFAIPSIRKALDLPPHFATPDVDKILKSKNLD